MLKYYLNLFHDSQSSFRLFTVNCIMKYFLFCCLVLIAKFVMFLHNFVKKLSGSQVMNGTKYLHPKIFTLSLNIK